VENLAEKTTPPQPQLLSISCCSDGRFAVSSD
jgi:hypothetical protein